MTLREVTVIAGELQDHGASWAEGWRVSLPPRLEKEVRPYIDTSQHLSLEVLAEHVVVSDVEFVRSVKAFTPKPPGSSRLPFSYQRIPSWARTRIGDVIGRLGRRRLTSAGSFPAWPLDLSADILDDPRRAVPESSDGPTPVLLTHDIDTSEGLRNLVERFLPIEEALGARSANYVVPCSWPLDHERLREVADRGHEIGVHGYDHSNRTPFVSRDECDRRLAEGLDGLGRYSPCGYRAPSLLRTTLLIDQLAGRYDYDSSVPTSGGLFPVPGNGCATARPFQIVDGLVEIPVSLPRDGSLRFLGYQPTEILTLWKELADGIKRSPGGVVCLLTHCEDRFSGEARMLEVYGRLVECFAADAGFEFVLPRNLPQLLLP